MWIKNKSKQDYFPKTRQTEYCFALEYCQKTITYKLKQISGYPAMKKILLLTTLLWLSLVAARGQLYDINANRNIRKIDIPFEYENNFIIVKVIFNDVFPLKFIFDTGAEHTILTRREITDLLQINYERKFTIKGADLKTDLYAYLATGVQLSINNLVAVNRPILVLEEDYFRVDRIDYRRQVITLYDPGKFEPPGGKFEEVPVEITRNKPYIVGDTKLTQDTTVAAKYLLDTGASISLLIYTNTHPALDLPPRYIRSKIGMGLGGFLEGFLGRVEQIDIGDAFQLPGVITNFQEIPPDVDQSFLHGRNGIIGNQVLNRFEIIIDYIGGRMYLEPQRNFNKRFEYDKSGLVIAASGEHLNKFIVVDLIANSPAADAGVQVGDRIVAVNRLPVGLLSLGSITKKLRKREGKRIRLAIVRGEERILFKFRLRRLI